MRVPIMREYPQFKMRTLKELRLELGFSIWELSKLMKCHCFEIWKAEHFPTQIRGELLCKYELYFQVKREEDIYFGTEKEMAKLRREVWKRIMYKLLEDIEEKKLKKRRRKLREEGLHGGYQ